MYFKVRYSVSVTANDVQPGDQLLYDCPLALLISIGDYLEEIEGCSLSIGGFGQDCWPVTVEPELSILMAQIPNALSSIERNEYFEIDFYEQGVERVLKFYPAINAYQIVCESRGHWIPEPNSIEYDKFALKNIFSELLEDFLLHIKYVKNDPKLARLLEEWVSGVWVL